MKLNNLFLLSLITNVFGAAVELDERNGGGIGLTNLPYPLPYYENPLLPDPFSSALTGRRATNKQQFESLQQEQSLLFEATELGPMAVKPDRLHGSLDNDTLIITAEVNGRSITYNATIVYPSAGRAPYPAMIAYSGISIPQPDNIAFIVFDNSNFAQQNAMYSASGIAYGGGDAFTTTRGQGQFYDLFGAAHPSSAMMAWAWGASRIVDVLEQLPQAKINPKRIGITGCSRDGKGALVAGAYDDRFVLTIPQESGSGGAACWRLSQYNLTHNDVVQTATEIVQENVWFSTSFERYANYTDQLPLDHHILAGLVAPRGLAIFENIGYPWLGPWSVYGCMVAARNIYEAVGATSNFGFSQDGPHNHCSFPTDDQGAELQAFYNKFLLDENVNTNVFRTNGGYSPDFSSWINWKTPRLF
ncbi:hypothetical protein AWJ20_2784 [Sugiyamaella lignohabitans]|uniref:(4-O-methyl)-D-glucuronate--lignin esterase n=1 Tax=Sugiyamaella lignohabitans TaxID=796027 RepID=A0A161HH17_9ASCO|nr:uncharacterized protein AWJ20_2784 [Sugiyamaella lignohabitans]ANB15160.1 hypothetical protein AWJ20_2784 [Sugiyamaella lignohabitans]